MSNKSNSAYINESNRCLHCAKPTCRLSCPIGNDVPTFLQYVSNNQHDKAVETIGHPFGEVCGYVCPHEIQCQGGCVMGKRGQAVQMGAVERAVFAEHPYKVERKGNSLHGLKVAVVGGGVSGITFAVKTYEQGANVTIYEKDKLLSTLKLIPDFRLPHEAVERVERAIEGKFTVVRQTVTHKDLIDLLGDGDCSSGSCYYDVVYLSTGASMLYGLGIAGEELATPYNEFLQGKPCCGDVVVIGGGNTAMDCARLAKRNGANVTVAYRRERGDMPAFQKEIDDAVCDGVKFSFNLAPVKLEQSGNRLQLTLAKTVSEGRGKLTVTDKTTVVECDTVVAALGSAFDKSIFGTLPLGEDVKHPLTNLYVGGDAAGGKIVAKAVADALQAFKTIQEIKHK